MISGVSLVLVVVICILAKGFFAGSETALARFNSIQKEKSGEYTVQEGQIREHVKAHQRLLVTINIGSALAVVVGTVLLAINLRTRLGIRGELYALLIMAPLLILLGEVLPRVLFQHYAERMAPGLQRILNAWRILFTPLVIIVGGCGSLLRKIMRTESDTLTPFVSRDELQEILTDPAAASELQVHERQMIERIFDFSETSVEDAMVPLIEVQAFDQSTTVATALPRVTQKMHSRYPIYRGRIDDLVGLVYSIDLVDAPSPETQLKELMRPCFYVPETMPVSELLARMQKENFIMAVAVDEYGGCVGVITREDILEEIVGEIEDEYDEEELLIKPQGPGRWAVSARTEIEQIEQELGLVIPEGPYETLGGFIITRFMRIPRNAEKFKLGNWTLEILEADDRSIHEVLLTRKTQEIKPS